MRHQRFIAAAAASLALGVTGLSGLVSISAPGASRAIALRTTSAGATTNPATNIPPTPDYWPACLTYGPSSSECISTELTAIDNARALEGVGPMVLPAGFASMSSAVQTFVVSNLERVDRGLIPAAGMVDTLNTTSLTAAQNDADPVLSGWTVGPFNANRWGSIWAGDENALAADYDWMYNDGWGPSGSYNLDCTTATDAGCWGHRDNILSSYGGEELITGVGSVVQSQWTSIAQIFVAGFGSYPSFTLSWSQVLGGSGTSPVGTPNTTTASPDATAASVSAPSTITAGQTARVVGRLVDTTKGLPIAGATVLLCHHTTTSSTTSCNSGTTDSTGHATLSYRPTTSTVYWLRYRGSTTHAAVSSHGVTVHVRPAVHLSRSHWSTGWHIAATLYPSRGQTVRLQRATSSGWVTVRTRIASSSMAWSRLRSGTYRVVVSSVPGLLSAAPHIRCV